MKLLVLLFIAHLLGDFFLQRNNWVRDKELRKWKSIHLYYHTLIHFLLLILLTGTVNLIDADAAGGFFYFMLPASIIALSHLLIDGLKLSLQTERSRRAWFFLDQLLHIAVLITVWIFFTTVDLFIDKRQFHNLLIVAAGALFVTRPASFFISTIISRWPREIKQGDSGVIKTAEDRESLENAGELIGMLERLIIFLFILLGRWEGVGFLLAAKSVFRFGDLKDARDMKLTEYVLIGTLLSFGIAMLTGILVIWGMV